MNVTVKVPSNLNDITIGQYQRLHKLNESDLEGVALDNEILKLFTGVDNVGGISQKDRGGLLESITLALSNEGEFKQRVKLEHLTLGMIPNFDKIVGSEYTDLIKYADSVEDLHRFMAVAYRPIKHKDAFSNYSIVNYSGTSELSEVMKHLPMSIVKGFNGFFLTLSNDLEGHIQRCTAEAQAKELKRVTSLESGVGMPPLMN
jgi:hypothetical protein